MAFFQAQHVWVEESAAGIATLIFDGPDKANHLDAGVLDELEQALARIEAEPRFRLCVLSSRRGACFSNGVSAATWSSLKTPESWDALCQQGQRICNHLAEMQTPTAALISGSCLAGGLELALACDWRVAIDKPTTLLGFAELESGLAPNWGGIARVIQLLGLERSLQFTLGNKRYSAREAWRCGLVDELVAPDAQEPPQLFERPRKRSPGDGPRKSWRQRLLESTGWGRRLILRGAQRVLKRRTPDDMPAPWELLEGIRAAVDRGAAASAEQLRAAVTRLAASAACGNLLRLQLIHQALQADTPQRGPKNIGILGATPLALHLAAQAAVKGCRVVLREKDELTLGMAALRLVKSMQDELARGAMSPDHFTSNVNRVRPTVSWKEFDELEVVIDATQGGIEAEQQLLREVEAHVADTAVIATVHPWRALAGWQSTLRRSGRAFVMHFPAPVGRTPLVELLTPPTPDMDALAVLQGLVSRLGKVSVIAQEATGGLIQRVFLAGFSESLHLLEEGIAPERVEQAMQRFGMVYGPLEHLDGWGLDEFILSARRLESVLLEAPAEHAIIQHMIERHWLGVKTGIGFYQHAGSSKSANRALARWLRRAYGGRAIPMSAAEQKKHIQQRLVGRMVNEAFRCLDDEVMIDADKVDAALTLVGWAPHRGGPCRYAEQMGFTEMVNWLQELAVSRGRRFEPCRGLLGRAGL